MGHSNRRARDLSVGSRKFVGGARHFGGTPTERIWSLHKGLMAVTPRAAQPIPAPALEQRNTGGLMAHGIPDGLRQTG